MNPISMVTGAISHPVRTAGHLTQQAFGVATVGVRTTLRVIDWAAGQGRGDARPGWAGEPTRVADQPTAARPATPAPPATPARPATTAAEKAPAKKAAAKKVAAKKVAAKKAPAKKAAPKKAPSARAATLAPALPPEAIEELEQEVSEDDGPITPSGIPAADAGRNPDTTETDLHQPGTPPVMDPGTVNSVLSEAETLRKAADPDKG